VRAASRIAAAGVCAAAAVLLALVALDAHTWSTRLAADDLRYRHDASATKLWRPTELSPGHLTRHLLGIGDDLAYRRALSDFRMGRLTEQVASTSITAHRIAAQVELTSVAANDPDPRVRSQADNLLGVLGFGLGSQDYGQRLAFFNNGITAFQHAVVLDPSNDDAYFNLEYALDQMLPPGDQQPKGSSELGTHGNAGLKSPGHGY
jgi:hypothetical protein